MFFFFLSHLFKSLFPLLAFFSPHFAVPDTSKLGFVAPDTPPPTTSSVRLKPKLSLPQVALFPTSNQKKILISLLSQIIIFFLSTVDRLMIESERPAADRGNLPHLKEDSMKKLFCTKKNGTIFLLVDILNFTLNPIIDQCLSSLSDPKEFVERPKFLVTIVCRNHVPSYFTEERLKCCE